VQRARAAPAPAFAAAVAAAEARAGDFFERARRSSALPPASGPAFGPASGLQGCPGPAGRHGTAKGAHGGAEAREEELEAART